MVRTMYHQYKYLNCVLTYLDKKVDRSVLTVIFHRYLVLPFIPKPLNPLLNKGRKDGYDPSSHYV